MRTMKEQRASTRKTMKFLNDLSKVSNVEIDALLKNDAGEVIKWVKGSGKPPVLTVGMNRNPL